MGYYAAWCRPPRHGFRFVIYTQDHEPAVSTSTSPAVGAGEAQPARSGGARGGKHRHQAVRHATAMDASGGARAHFSGMGEDHARKPDPLRTSCGGRGRGARPCWRAPPGERRRTTARRPGGRSTSPMAAPSFRPSGRGPSGRHGHLARGHRDRGLGLNLHGPPWDVDLFVPALIDGVFGTRAWYRELARAPVARSRQGPPPPGANGTKGGRPRRWRAAEGRRARASSACLLRRGRGRLDGGEGLEDAVGVLRPAGTR